MSDNIKRNNTLIHVVREGCNYHCVFCAHLAIGTAVEKDPQVVLMAIQAIGNSHIFKKVTLSGGEPLLYPEETAMLLKAYKRQGLVTSLISNASVIKEEWLRQNAANIDLFGFSLDSFDDDVNFKLGRCSFDLTSGTPFKPHRQGVEEAIQVCHELRIEVKINTVVNKLNFREVMWPKIQKLGIHYWKVMKIGILPTGRRDALDFAITNEEFNEFLHINKGGIDAGVLRQELKSDSIKEYIVLMPNMAFQKQLGSSQVEYTKSVVRVDPTTGCCAKTEDIEDLLKDSNPGIFAGKSDPSTGQTTITNLQ